jgi:hypothetical protein
MTEPTLDRDDLYVWRIDSHTGDGGYDALGKAEFDFIARKDGWVKLDVDVTELRAGIDLHRKDYHSDPALIGRYLRLARAVLAALDPGDDTRGQE